MRILLVEDDAELGGAVRDALRRRDYVVDWMRSGEEAEAAIAAQDYLVILLDLGLPGMEGLELLHRLRGRARLYVPVIIISARDRQVHRVEGLDAGADDYLVKPFDIDELAARIRAQVRRRDDRGSDVLVHRDVELDLRGRIVRYRGVPASLTAKEFRILATLMRRAGRYVSKADLEEAVYDGEAEFESNTIEVAISSIRRKLARDVIVTTRGLGYSVPR